MELIQTIRLGYDKLKPNKNKIILVIMDVKANSHGLNFVLVEAFPKGEVGAVYLARIKGVLRSKGK
jgi:predicted Zn-dependent protease